MKFALLSPEPKEMFIRNDPLLLKQNRLKIDADRYNNAGFPSCHSMFSIDNSSKRSLEYVNKIGDAANARLTAAIHKAHRLDRDDVEVLLEFVGRLDDLENIKKDVELALSLKGYSHVRTDWAAPADDICQIHRRDLKVKFNC